MIQVFVFWFFKIFTPDNEELVHCQTASEWQSQHLNPGQNDPKVSSLPIQRPCMEVSLRPSKVGSTLDRWGCEAERSDVPH